MKPKVSLQCLRETTNGSHTESDESIPHSYIQFL